MVLNVPHVRLRSLPKFYPRPWRKILTQIEKSPLGLFSITMQNHKTVLGNLKNIRKDVF